MSEAQCEVQCSVLPCFRYQQSACGTRKKHVQPGINGIRGESDGDKQSEVQIMLFQVSKSYIISYKFYKLTVTLSWLIV